MRLCVEFGHESWVSVRMIMSLLIAAAIVPSGQIFTCTPTRVWDGDGPVWCAEGPRVRLSGIAAREMDGSCKTGHPCPAADPRVSRDALVRLVGAPIGVAREGHIIVSGPAMSCRSDGGAGGDRTAAFCVSPGSGDLSCQMVAGKWAAIWPRYWRKHRCT